MNELLVEQPEPELGLRGAVDTPAAITFENTASPRVLHRIILDEQGLTEVYRHRQLVTPWDEIYGVTWKDRSVAIKFAGRTLMLRDNFAGWRRLGGEVEQRAVLLRPESRPAEVTDERIAEWLGIPLDGALRCSFGRRRLWGWAIIAMWLLIAVVPLIFNHEMSGNLGSTWMMLWIAAAMLASADHVSADVHGISLRVKGKPQTYAWAEIESVKDDGQSLTVTTSRGKFSLASSMPGSEKLRLTIRHVAEAKRLGLELPDERPISETAISRSSGATPTDEAVERGLSRSAD